jgi:hypothetical protein
MQIRCRHRAFAAAVLAAVGVSGCGGGGVPGGPSSPVPTPPPPPVTNVLSEGSSALGASTVAPVVFTTESAGTLEVIVDWTFAANDVDIFLARGSSPCTLETFNDRTCGFVATEESMTMKPERLRTTSLAAGTYSLYVANFGDVEESVSWQVLLTSGVGSAASAPVAAGGAGHKAALVRMGEPR